MCIRDRIGTFVRLAGQHAHEHRPQAPGTDRRPGRQGQRVTQHGHGGGADVGGLALDGGVQGGGQRPQVGGRAAALAAQPFGSDVAGRADEQARLGDRGQILQPGDAEVGQHHPAVVGQEHVGRLHVAVLDAVGVRGGQRVQHPQPERRHPLRRPGALGGHRVLQVAALQQLHDDPGHAVVGEHVVDLDDLRMAQLGGGLGLAGRALQRLLALGGGERVGEPYFLDRDLAVEEFVVGVPDGPHASLTERSEHAVAGGDSLFRKSRHNGNSIETPFRFAIFRPNPCDDRPTERI